MRSTTLSLSARLLLALFTLLSISSCKKGGVDEFLGNQTIVGGSSPSTSILISSPASGDYGSQTINVSASKAFVILNVGTSPVPVSSAGISGAAYSITSTTCTSVTVQAGESCQVVVSFLPTTAATLTGSLTVTYTGNSGPSTLTIGLSGTGVTLAPSLSSAPIADFGTVNTSQTGSKTIAITNSGSITVALTVLSITGTGYSITTNNCNGQTLAPAASCTMILGFSPLITGASLGQLSVPYTYNAGVDNGTHVVAITGIGNVPQPTLTASPTTWNYGNVATNQSSSKIFTISNNTTVTGIVQTASITGSGYTVTANTCNSTTLSAGASCSVTVSFAPNTLTSTTSVLTIPYLSTQGISYTLDINLGGTGIAPSVSFAFSGFTGNSGTDTSNLTATGVRLLWTAQPLASYYKIFQTVGGTTTQIATVTPSSTALYNVSGLAINTTYTFRINAYDTLDTSDGNSNTVSITTPNVTGATFNGWSDLVATGSVSTSIGSINATMTSATGCASGTAPCLAITSDTVKVKLAWETFTFTPSGTATDYNVYRTTTSGSGYTLIGSSGSTTTQYIDTTAVETTTYYYLIKPVISGVEINPTVTTDSEIRVFVPPANMALVHRWITNREECVNLLGATWPGGIDRTNNYRCAYTWGSGYAPNYTGSKLHWDIGYSFITDRWQAGCKMTATGPMYGAAAPATGSNGDIYFKQGPAVTTYDLASTGTGMKCYYKTGGTWYDFQSGSITSAQRALMTANAPGYPPINTDQAKAYGACSNRSVTGVGALRLPRQSEVIAMRAWAGVFNTPSSAQVIARTTGIDHPTYGSCNTKAADLAGVTDPSLTFINQFYLMPAASYNTRNCKSRYDISDTIGNMTEVTGDQAVNCTTASATCKGALSALDSGSTLIEDYPFDNTTYGTVCWNCGGTTSNNLIPFLGLLNATASSAIGTRLKTLITTPSNNGIMQIPGGGAALVAITGYHYAPGNASAPARMSYFMDGVTALGTNGGYGNINGFRCTGQVGP